MDWPHLSFSHNADVQVIIIFLFGKGKVKSWDRSSGTPITSAFLGTSHGFAIYEPGWKERRLDDRNTLIMVVRSSEKRRPSFIMELQFFLCYRNFYFLQCTVRKMRHFWRIFYHCGIAFSRAVSILYQSANAVSKINLTLLHGVWKSQKKSHSTLRATFTFYVDKKLH